MVKKSPPRRRKTDKTAAPAITPRYIADMSDGRPSSEWTFPLLERAEKELGDIARDTFQLDAYPNQIEIVSSEQMMDAYSSTGMPTFYHHWSFGKQFVQVEKAYRRGQMGLAYELVINSNPCISYLMEENTMMMQMLVIAHACFGHNSFFKNNYLFKKWTDAEAIIDYLIFSRDFIAKCEEEHGYEEVEIFLDACHALRDYGVDRYGHPPKLSVAEEKKRQKERADYLQTQVNDLWERTIPKMASSEKKEKKFPEEPQENILYFIEKNSPVLEPWQREIVRITRKISQYFFPQRQTKVMNEGWATFWHYTILNEAYDRGLIPDGFMMEFLSSHTGVTFQPGYDETRRIVIGIDPKTGEPIYRDIPIYSGINPYALGFNMFRDIRRICEHPTEEDKKWFPEIAGAPWLPTLHAAMRDFKDESFILQFLSPQVIRDMKLWGILDNPYANPTELEVCAIHDQEGYREIRTLLAEQYELGTLQPNIEVTNVNFRGDRTLTLEHKIYKGRPLHEKDMELTLRHLYTTLWGHPVRLEADRGKGLGIVCQFPPAASQKIGYPYY